MISWRPGHSPGLCFLARNERFRAAASSLTSASGYVKIRVSRAFSRVSCGEAAYSFPAWSSCPRWSVCSKCFGTRRFGGVSSSASRGWFEAHRAGTGGRAGADRGLDGLAQPPDPKLAYGTRIADRSIGERANWRMGRPEDFPAGCRAGAAAAFAVCLSAQPGRGRLEAGRGLGGVRRLGSIGEFADRLGLRSWGHGSGVGDLQTAVQANAAQHWEASGVHVDVSYARTRGFAG